MSWHRTSLLTCAVKCSDCGEETKVLVETIQFLPKAERPNSHRPLVHTQCRACSERLEQTFEAVKGLGGLR